MHVILSSIYGIAFWLIFLVCALIALLLVSILPVLSWRQRAARACARTVFVLTGTDPQVHEAGRLPSGPSVVVANHASYLDGVLLFALLPNGFSFVIKAEMQAVPLAGFVLRRLGSFFVEREHIQRSARSARQVMRAARDGRPIGFFPEGTFTEVPGLARFRKGAFATAKKAGLPVVPVAITGTRHILPADRWLPRPGTITVNILEAIDAAEVRKLDTPDLMSKARSAIARSLDEPDLLIDGGKTSAG